MASINYSENSVEELQTLLVSQETEFESMRFDHAMDGLPNPVLLRNARREVARIKTELRKRELANASEEYIAGRSKIRFRRRK